MKDAYRRPRLRRSHNGKYLVPQTFPVVNRFFHPRSAVNPDRHLAPSAQSRQGSPLSRHRKPRRRIVQERNRRNRSRIVLPRLDPQRSLPRRRAKILRLQPLPHPLRLLEAIEPRRGQQNRIHLPLGQLAQPRVHIAGRSAFNCARRRWLLVPTRAPRGKSASLAYFTDTNTSLGSTLLGVAASAKGSGSSVGKSFKECTARSTLPSASASSISFVNIPFDPTCANVTSCSRSPVVLMISIATLCPSARSSPAMW